MAGKNIDKLLSKDPDDRFYDARAVRLALEDVGTKVMAGASVTQQTMAGDATVAATQQSKKQLKKLLGKKRKKKKRTLTPFYEKAWFLGLCLVVLIAVVTWLVWPMSDEERFALGEAKIAEAAKLADDDEQRADLFLEAREKYFQPLIESSPDGPHAERVRKYLDEIETDRVSRQVENRIRHNREPKSKVERNYMAARRSQKEGDRVTAIYQFRSMITLFKDRKTDRFYVVLAKQRIGEIQSKGSDTNESREIILEGMKRAEKHLEKDETIEADKIYTAIIDVYQGNRELEPLVQKAHTARESLKNKEPAG